MSEARAKSVLRRIRQILRKKELTTGQLYDQKTDKCCFLGAWAIADPELKHPADDSIKDEYNYMDFNRPQVSDVGTALLEAAKELYPTKAESIKAPADLFEINDDTGTYDYSADSLNERIDRIVERAMEKVS